MLEIKPSEEAVVGCRILVVGVGGGGNNTLNRMIEADIFGVDYLAVNTDKQALMLSKATHTIQIGEKTTRGRGAGFKPEVGEAAAQESKEEITNFLKNYEMVFVTCGMGGGTGTGAAPVIARIAKDLGILTVGVVTKPFAFEGGKKMRYALAGIERLREGVDAFIVIPNERLIETVDADRDFQDAFKDVDEVLYKTVRGITDMINTTSSMNLDFSDVRTVLENAGVAHIGMGHVKGKRGKVDSKNTITNEDINNIRNNGQVDTAAFNTLREKVSKTLEWNAMERAINDPLLESTIKGAKNFIFYFDGDVRIRAASAAMEILLIENGIDKDADDFTVIPGYNPRQTTKQNSDGLDSSDDSYFSEVNVTVVATGMPEGDEEEENFMQAGTPFIQPRIPVPPKVQPSHQYAAVTDRYGNVQQNVAPIRRENVQQVNNVPQAEQGVRQTKPVREVSEAPVQLPPYTPTKPIRSNIETKALQMPEFLRRK